MTKQIELIDGTARDASLSQFFTPSSLARRLVEWALAGGLYYRNNPDSQHEGHHPARVLEPSAGNGAIVRELVAAGAEVHAVEIDTRYEPELKAIGFTGLLYCPKDFMQCGMSLGGWPWTYDLSVGNFPFHLDLDGGFTLHALKFAPRVCAIYPSNVFYIAKRPWPGATDYVALELVKRSRWEEHPGFACEGPDLRLTVEWWFESWH